MLAANQYPITHSTPEKSAEAQVIMARAAIRLSQKARHAMSKAALPHSLQTCATSIKSSKQCKTDELKRTISAPRLASCSWVESWLCEQKQHCGEEEVLDFSQDSDQNTLCSFTSKDEDQKSISTTSTVRSYTFF